MLLLLVSFPSTFFSRMRCIINIAIVFAIIQHDGATLNHRKPYYLINSTQSYSCHWMYGVCHQWPTRYISIHPWKIVTVLFSMHCWNTFNSQGAFEMQFLVLKNIIIIHWFISFGKRSLDKILFSQHVIGKINICLQIFCWNICYFK